MLFGSHKLWFGPIVVVNFAVLSGTSQWLVNLKYLVFLNFYKRPPVFLVHVWIWLCCPESKCYALLLSLCHAFWLLCEFCCSEILVHLPWIISWHSNLIFTVCYIIHCNFVPYIAALVRLACPALGLAVFYWLVSTWIVGPQYVNHHAVFVLGMWKRWFKAVQTQNGGRTVLHSEYTVTNKI
jgi:hypothetical protein